VGASQSLRPHDPAPWWALGVPRRRQAIAELCVVRVTLPVIVLGRILAPPTLMQAATMVSAQTEISLVHERRSKSGVLTTPADSAYLYVVMPMRLRS
jgi:hypothetical protein